MSRPAGGNDADGPDEARLPLLAEAVDGLPAVLMLPLDDEALEDEALEDEELAGLAGRELDGELEALLELEDELEELDGIGGVELWDDC